MKKLYVFVFISVVGISLGKAQDLVPEVTNNYSLTVITKVQDVVNAANISQSEQVPLANLFQAESDNISNALINNATGARDLIVDFHFIII